MSFLHFGGKRSDFLASVEKLCHTLQQPQITGQEVQKELLQVIKTVSKATSDQMAEGLAQMVALIEHLSFQRAAVLALGCGALIEQGAPAEVASKPILTVTRTALSEIQPDVENAIGTIDMLVNATLAIAMRLPSIRIELAQDTEFLASCRPYQDQSNAIECLLDLFKVLDNESIIVLHPESGRGYRIVISGIGKNFELHTLLADAVCGDPAEGKIPGERPDPRVVAAAQDVPFLLPGEDDTSFPTALSYLNLWNLTGIRQDGTLPAEQREILERTDHFIWNEGIPADIVPFEGQRIILLSSVPFSRSWNAGRFFPGLKGELHVAEVLSSDTVQAWCQRLALAAAKLG